MDNKKTGLDSLYALLNQADRTYQNLPAKMQMDIQKISKGLDEFGPRKLRRRGLGTELFEFRDFRNGVDDPRRISHRHSARMDRYIVIEHEAEIRQHVYLWRDPSGTMDFASKKDLFTKRQSAEIMLLAMAKHLVKNEEMVGVLDQKGMFRGTRAPENMARQLLSVDVLTSDMPSLGRKMPRHSTVMMFGDFLAPREKIAKTLAGISGQDLHGFMIMVLDPQEIDFDMYKGHTEFIGMEGEGKKAFKNAQAIRDEYIEKMKAHIKMVEDLCKARGFQFIVQRTDQPLHNALMAIYGLTPNQPGQLPVNNLT